MKKLLVAVSVACAVVAGFVLVDNMVNPAQAKDCSANAVVQCGVWSAAEMRQAYNSDKTPGTKNIFAGMGITSDMVNHSTVKEGTVGKDGRVIVGGEVVATDAASAGRTVMSHTTQRVKREVNGTVYYESATSDSFRSGTLAAYVFFDADGRFQGAVIKDCGNPVKGKPTKPAPKKIKVCELATNKYPVEIKETEFDKNKHSTNPKDCVPMTVCRLSDNKYPVEIKESQFDSTKYSKNPADCKEIKVCRLEDKKYPVTIKESEFDEKKYSKNKEDCLTPGISVTKKVDGVDHKAVEKNVEFTYQIRVKNTGDADLKNVAVKDEAESGVTFIAASHGTVSGRTWNYTIPELKKGAHMDFTITAKVPEYKAGKIKNTVCVDAPSVPGNPDDCDDATVEVPKPENMVVCVLEGKKYPVTINKEDFDAKLHSTNAKDCEETLVTPPEVPELPKTGAADSLMNMLGLGALTTAILAYGASRRF